MIEQTEQLVRQTPSPTGSEVLAAAPRPLNRASMRSCAAVGVIALSGVASTAHTLQFTSNQQTYLARAVAAARESHILDKDWFVHTADPVPLFTALVTPLLRLGDWGLSLLNVLVGALFLTALAWIAREEAGRGKRRQHALIGWVAGFAFLWTSVPNSVRGVLFDGLAEQRAYSPYLQPSNAGVLLVVAVALALARRPVLAVLMGAAAAWLHPTYALSSLVLSAGICLGKSELSARSRVELAVTACVAVLPPVLLSLHTFAPESSALAHEAGRILVAERMPHHALATAWSNPTVLVRLVPVFLALALCRGAGRSRLLIWTLLTAAATAAVVASGCDELALLFPWRTTVWLVPVCAAIALGRLSAAWCWSTRLRGLQMSLAGVMVLVAVLSCLNATRALVHQSVGDDFRGVSLAQTIDPSERQRWVILTPVDWEGVRLNAPAAIYVDFKSHPYRDVEVIEWWRRVQLTRRAYGLGGEPIDCAAIEQLLRSEPQLGFVLSPPERDLDRCASLVDSKRGADGVLYRIRGRTAAEYSVAGLR